MANNQTNSNGQKSGSTLPPTYHKIWVDNGNIRYLVGGKKATVRARAEVELQKLNNGSSCLVCSAPSDEYHYGARACQNCCDFFRLSVTECPEYICTTGGKCRVNCDDLSATCPACRMRKCIFNGMKVSEVVCQPNNQENNSAVSGVSISSTSSVKPNETSPSTPEKVPRPTPGKTASSSGSLANVSTEFRKRIMANNDNVVDTAKIARDNVAKNVQFLVNLMMNVGQNLVSQIDSFVESELKKNSDCLKRLEELEKSMNSSEMQSQITNFLNENMPSQSNRVTYAVSKFAKDKSAVEKLFNVPMLNESPLPAYHIPTTSADYFSIISTLPEESASSSVFPNLNKSDANTAENSIGVTGSSEELRLAAKKRLIPKTDDKAGNSSEKYKKARRVVDEEVEETSENVGHTSTAKRKVITQDSGSNAEQSVVPKKSKANVQRIDSPDSEKKAPVDEAERKRLRMEKLYEKQERRRRREEERRQRESEQTSISQKSKDKSSQSSKETCRVDKSCKSIEKRKENSSLSCSLSTHSSSVHKKIDEDKRLKTSITKNTASSSSHPSLKKNGKTCQLKLIRGKGEEKLSEMDQLLTRYGFKLKVAVSVMNMTDAPAIVRRFGGAMITSSSVLQKIGEVDSGKTPDENTDLRSRSNESDSAAIIHNFIPTVSVPITDNRDPIVKHVRIPQSETSTPSAEQERMRKAQSEQPLKASSEARDREKASSVQP